MKPLSGKHNTFVLTRTRGCVNAAHAFCSCVHGLVAGDTRHPQTDSHDLMNMCCDPTLKGGGGQDTGAGGGFCQAHARNQQPRVQRCDDEGRMCEGERTHTRARTHIHTHTHTHIDTNQETRAHMPTHIPTHALISHWKTPGRVMQGPAVITDPAGLVQQQCMGGEDHEVGAAFQCLVPLLFSSLPLIHKAGCHATSTRLP